MAKRIPAGLTPAEGRRFGLTVGGAFLVLAGLMFWRDHTTFQTVFGAVGIALVGAGLLVPARLGPIQRAWMGLAHAISKVTTPIFLGIVYFLVMMPIGLLMRMLGRNPVRHDARGDTYWAPRDDARGGMTNQF